MHTFEQACEALCSWFSDALDNMVRVADHINEMKRISDTYYSVFEAMLRESKLTEVHMFMLCIVKFLIQV